MAPRSAALLCAVAAAALLLGAPACAHFVLRDPPPYNPIDCHKPMCQMPCPPIWLTGPAAAQTSPENPARQWSRGDEVDIEWHRNNHEGGFYRYSLVPVKFMHNWRWHAKTAFEYGCWAQGRWECGFDNTCGSDAKGFAYRNRVRIPHVFPDGDYVFAMSWFGGIHWRRHRGFWPDYHSCAFVRVEGGEYRRRWNPKFVPGTSHRGAHHVPPGKCVSSSRWIGECGGRGCQLRTPYKGLPGIFQGKNRPKPLLFRDLNGKFPNRATRLDLQFGTMQQELAYIIEDIRERHRDIKQVNEERAARRRGTGPRGADIPL